MQDQLFQLIHQANPWLRNPKHSIVENDYIPRLQLSTLLLPEWDKLWTVLIGPRQAGKTTLAKHVSAALIQERRFETLIYLNCDLMLIRQWLTNPLFIQELQDTFHFKKFIILIDEVQRLENPGLLLKACADLKLSVKLLATGSSQLEMKSKVQEYLTGRHLEVLVLPLSYTEIGDINPLQFVYGCYPAIVKTTEKQILLQQIYRDYIEKDIIEILKIAKPDTIQKLITLIAHSAGQLVNYNQLATDCLVAVATVQHYLSILENTYVIQRISPFVGNKRKEITSNPVFYFIDNGFRNQALHNFTIDLAIRPDSGLLIQNAVFQELLKFKVQNFYDFSIHFWRTQSGAEIDFVIYKNENCIIPIEAKFHTMQRPRITRAFRSFIDAYQPKYGFFITKNFNQKIMINQCEVHFISVLQLATLYTKLKEIL